MAQLTLEKIKFKTKEEKPCQLTFAVSVPPELVSAKEEDVAKEFQKAAQLPGFRAGNAPLDLVKRNFSEKVKSQTVDELLKEVVHHILEEKSLMPVVTPMVNELKLDDKQSLSFSLIVERSPDFKVKSYNKIPLEKKVKSVADSDVQKELDELRERNSQLVQSKAEKAASEHFAVIDYQGFLDGKPAPDLKAQNQLIRLEAPQTIQGFAEGILGMGRAESKDVSVQFPAEYPAKNLAGKPVTFKITLQDIKEKSLPAFDDEFAKDFGLNSLEELRSKISESLKHASEKSARADMEKQVYDRLIEENAIPVPDSLVAMQLESLVEQALSNQPAGGQDNTPEKIEERKKALREKYKSHAERLVRLSYLINGVAKSEKLAATEEDWKAEMEKAGRDNPEKEAEIQRYFREYRSRIMSRITEDKVLNFLIDHAKVKEVTA